MLRYFADFAHPLNMKQRTQNVYFLISALICCVLFNLGVLGLQHQFGVATKASPTPITSSLCVSRRAAIGQGLLLGGAWATATICTPAWATGAPSSFEDLLSQVQMAQKQLEQVPSLIESEKWDSVRAILIAPPLADCWAKSSRPLVSKYAEELGNLGGDELAALEAREDLQGHLRYLDMAVYNNVFNPIKVEGKSGATKELIRSYYEDPINELKASKAALQELINLARDL